MAFTYVTLTRRYKKGNGAPAAGKVRFTPTDPMVNGDTVVEAAVDGVLDTEGNLAALLAANTDPGTTPADPGVTWQVDELIEGQKPRRYFIEVPHDQGATIALSSLQQLTVPPAYVAPVPIAMSSVTGLVAALEDVEGGAGVPPGGTTGQALRKTSGADGAVGWSTQKLSELGDVSTAGAQVGGPLIATEVDGDGEPTEHGYGPIPVVNTDAAPGRTIFVGATSPTSPAVGDVWISPAA